jgi:hypothetical protein
MSLINDALNRAKEAQKNAESTSSPPPALTFRAVDAKEHRKFTWALPSLITAVVLTTGFLIWELSDRRKSRIEDSPSSVAPANGGQKETRKGAETSLLSPAPMEVHAREQHPAAAKGSSAPTSRDPNWGTVENKGVAFVSDTSIQEQRTNSNPPSDIPAKASGPKLQAIVYNPANPSAMINSKTVFIGEKVGEWKVTKIDKESATLIGAGQTNVLRLGE